MSRLFHSPQGGNSRLQFVGSLQIFSSVGNSVALLSPGAVSFGNTTDNPGFSFLGTGIATFSGAVVAASGLKSVALAGEGITVTGSGVGAANQSYIAFRDSANTRIGYVGDSVVGTLDINLVSDSGSVGLSPGGTQAIVAGASSINFGDSGRNQIFNFLGTGAGTVNGKWTFNAPAGSRAADFVGSPNQYTLFVRGSTTSVSSFGLLMQAGTTTGDVCFAFANALGTINILNSDGVGNIVAGNVNVYPTFTINGAFRQNYNGSGLGIFNSTVPGWISVQTNNTAVCYLGDSSTLINSGTVGSTTLRADTSLTLAVNLGNVQAAVINTAGIITTNFGIFATASSGNTAIRIASQNVASNSFGLTITSGTNTSDWALNISNAANNTAFFRAFGDGSVVVGNPTGGLGGLGTINAQNLFIQGNTVASTITGSFTGTVSGFFSGNITGTINYVVVGKMATLYTTAAIQSTSSTTTMSMSGLPAVVQPAVSVTNIPCANLVDASFSCLGTASIGAGTITFGLVLVNGARNLTNQQTGFQSSGTKGIGANWSVTYPIG